MGAKWIFDIAIEKNFPSAAELELIRRIEANTGRKVKPWQVSYTVHAPADKKRPPLEVISLSDADDRLFTLLNKGLTICETEPAFLPMIKRISSYQHKLTRTIRGTEYDFFDFCVKVGLVFDRNDSAYGMVVEIEYRPCVIAKDCEKMATELMEKLAGHLVPPPQKGRDRKTSEVSVAPYEYKKVELEAKKLNPPDVNPFSHRTTALLYAQYLR